MAITLRNKVVEDKIKRLAERTGLGPSAVIARAIDRELERLDGEAAAKLADLEAIRTRFPHWTRDEKEASRQAEQELFDYLYASGEPRLGRRR
jgi:hypothetical protein